MGNLKEAIKHLERAVKLRPEDAVLNDHLGDALWRIGRHDNAKAQWEMALTLKPTAEDAHKITNKIANGLSK
jgi:Flp pilus assembly protein TadD